MSSLADIDKKHGIKVTIGKEPIKIEIDGIDVTNALNEVQLNFTPEGCWAIIGGRVDELEVDFDFDRISIGEHTNPLDTVTVNHIREWQLDGDYSADSAENIYRHLKNLG